MLEISYEINGKKVNPNNIADALEKAVLQQFSESIKKSVGTIRCSEHKQSPKVLLKGKSLDNLSIEVSGCCDDLVKRVSKRFS